MDLAQYVTNSYNKDVRILIDNHMTCLCRRSWSEFFSKGLQHQVTDLQKLIICLYELNLIDQIIYTHFNSESQRWLDYRPKSISYRCIYMSRPIDIIPISKEFAKTHQYDLTLSKEAFLAADQYFLGMLHRFNAESGSRGILSTNAIINAMANDPDCNPQSLLLHLD